MHVRKGDQVLVLAGDDRGKRGRVLKVFPDRGRVIVEGINFIKRHARPSRQNPQGGIIEKEAPIHASNVMVVCPKCGKPTRIAMKILSGDSRPKRARVCKQCGEMIVSGG